MNTSLLLTNRVKNLKTLISFLLAIGLVTYVSVFAKGCDNTVTNGKARSLFPNNARMISPIIIDTTKKPTVFNQLYLRKIDTLELIVSNYLGKSMTVDNSDQLKAIFFRITHELKTDTAQHGK